MLTSQIHARTRGIERESVRESDRDKDRVSECVCGVIHLDWFREQGRVVVSDKQIIYKIIL